MDQYLREENIQIFKKWVYYQIISHDELKLREIDEKTYEIIYKTKIGRFVIWHNGIIEEEIRDGENVIFYLHFKFHNYSYATDLFNRMISKLLEESDNDKCHILLCCSSGLTTGYFADRANQYCKLNQLPYVIEATSVNEIPVLSHCYEMILFAPQIQYSMRELNKKIDNCKLIMIDANTFATYDCAKLINIINSNK